MAGDLVGGVVAACYFFADTGEQRIDGDQEILRRQAIPARIPHGRLFGAEPAKETELNDLTHSLVKCSQIAQRIVKREHFCVWIGAGNSKVFMKRYLLRVASVLHLEPGAGIVRENVPHQMRTHPEEMRAALPIGFTDVA